MNDILDVGEVKCYCGCGMSADQFYKGVPIPAVNPILHYRKYQQKVRENVDKRRESLMVKDNTLEHFDREEFERARRQI